jgi:hypothetical protein
MRPTMWLSLAAIAAVLAGCGDTAHEETPGAGATGAGAASASGAGGSTGPGSGPGGAGSGGATTGETVTLTMDKFTVPAGGEVFKCQNFANPFGGGVAEVQKFESHMTPGSHHLLLFYREGASDGGLEDCSGLEFDATPYSTQLPDDQTSYPQGVAAKIEPTTGLRMQSHYLNTTNEDIEATVSITFHLAEPGSIALHAGVLFVIQPNILVGPNQTEVVEHDCQLPVGMNMLKAASHMHKHGTSFEATVAGETVFATTEWAEPDPAFFDPAKTFQSGDPLHFECTFVNNSTQTLVFGESAENNEMCIFVASFYPVPEGTVTVGCN